MLNILQNETRKAKELYEAVKEENERLREEVTRIKREKLNLESNSKLKQEQLETLEKTYKNLLDQNLASSYEKDEASKVTNIF